MKLPNRDSGIDSPSSSVAGENFPCEEGSGVSPGPAMLGPHPKTAVDSQASQDTPQEEADSDMGEETVPENTSSRTDEDISPTQVGLSFHHSTLGSHSSPGRGLWWVTQEWSTCSTQGETPGIGSTEQ
jgi:hypothetical protein